MKKLLSILGLMVIVTPSLNVISCEQIETFPSKHANVKTSSLEKFFEQKNNIKPYNIDYIELINNSWEHIGFENNISTHKIDYSFVSISDSEIKSDFFSSLIELYEPTTADGINYDFTGLTFYIENIFLNLISVNSEFELTVNSDVAITIKKGWKTVGKILLTLENDVPYEKKETINFINKILLNMNYVFDITPNKLKSVENNYDYLINTSLTKDNFDDFYNEFSLKQKVITNLALSKSQFELSEENEVLYLNIEGYIYKIIS
ncbi:hypothetical protein SCORR_v1c05010 [Spiroplasma corruscae]|uniref:Lipoprotein n=1 Tax=Spiroplasma corruscae TaxID=216934 RepID=A0A222EPQ1_9MOLU|nr:lipoprotein [Spiroplasma corruscae]ASP28273.1 hypothetical protein SCORR_v1c05010 [Spiroplasma corruscae]